MIEHGHRRQCAHEKETDLANTEKHMTQYDPVTKPYVGLKTASVPIRRLHYYKAQHRDGKVPGRNPPRTLWQSTPGNQEAHPRKNTCAPATCAMIALQNRGFRLFIPSRFSTIKNDRTSPSQVESDSTTAEEKQATRKI